MTPRVAASTRLRRPREPRASRRAEALRRRAGRRGFTQAGPRPPTAPLTPVRCVSRLWAETAFAAPSDLVFPTGAGRPESRNNVRRRILLRAVARANETATDDARLPESLSPHALRRSYASWLVAEGEDPAFVMNQLGHTDPKMTLGLYAKALKSKRRRSTSTRNGTSPDAAPLDAELEEAR